MIVRIATMVLLAAVLLIGMSQLGVAASDTDDTSGYAVDNDRPDDAPIALASDLALPASDRQPVRLAWDVAASHGRLHAVSVFRPPRTVASR